MSIYKINVVRDEVIWMQFISKLFYLGCLQILSSYYVYLINTQLSKSEEGFDTTLCVVSLKEIQFRSLANWVES